MRAEIIEKCLSCGDDSCVVHHILSKTAVLWDTGEEIEVAQERFNGDGLDITDAQFTEVKE